MSSLLHALGSSSLHVTTGFDLLSDKERDGVDDQSSVDVARVFVVQQLGGRGGLQRGKTLPDPRLSSCVDAAAKMTTMGGVGGGGGDKDNGGDTETTINLMGRRQ